MTSPTPPRVRITSPRRDAARRSAAVRPSTREIDEDTGLGQVYMRTYLRGLRRRLGGFVSGFGPMGEVQPRG